MSPNNIDTIVAKQKMSYEKQFVKVTKEYPLVGLSASWQKTLNGLIVGIAVLGQEHPVLSEAGVKTLVRWKRALDDLQKGLRSAKTVKDIEAAFDNFNIAVRERIRREKVTKTCPVCHEEVEVFADDTICPNCQAENVDW